MAETTPPTNEQPFELGGGHLRHHAILHRRLTTREITAGFVFVWEVQVERGHRLRKFDAISAPAQGRIAMEMKFSRATAARIRRRYCATPVCFNVAFDAVPVP
jgi:hypothetical protein